MNRDGIHLLPHGGRGIGTKRLGSSQDNLMSWKWVHSFFCYWVADARFAPAMIHELRVTCIAQYIYIHECAFALHQEQKRDHFGAAAIDVHRMFHHDSTAKNP